MRNTLGDLNNHLFEQLERLNDDEINGEKLEEEISRARAITAIASKIIDNGSLVLDATKLKEDRFNADLKVPKMLGDNE